MTLCGQCQNLPVYDAIQRSLAENAVYEEYHGASIGDWHTQLLAVDRSSSGCRLCATVIKGWRQHWPIVADERIKSGDMVTTGGLPPELHEDITALTPYQDADISVLLQRFTGRAEDGRYKLQYFLHIELHPGHQSSADLYSSLDAVFRVTSGDSDTLSEGLEEVLVQPDPLSDKSIQISKTWLETCNSKHGSCATKSTQLPTRFLDVSRNTASDSIVLCELGRFRGDGDSRYIALSHCWGTGKNICTTRSTLNSHMGGIKISQLPQTFRDAVAVARNLEVRYLWIDSLCIIQDDVYDWQKESANMAAIYRDAYIVLAAARGKSDTDGFLGPRDRPDVVALTPPGPATTLTLQLQPPARDTNTNDVVDLMGDEPLNTRAWCLQEKYLASRVLLYGSQQMVWECQEVSASEDGDARHVAGGALVRIRQTANISASILNRVCRERYEGNHNVNHVEWYRMVEDYTNRRITKNSDRLPALSGLAKATAQLSKDEYLAGIWKSSIIEGLAWCSNYGAGALVKPDEYIAPSWSWTSVVGQVAFPLYKWYDRARWKARMADFEPLATYAGHEFQLRDQDPDGRLRGGWLCINAALWPITSIEAKQTEEPLIVLYFGQEPERSPFTNKTIGVYYETPFETTQFWVEGGFDKSSTCFSDDDQLFVLFLARLPFVLENGFIDYRFGLIVKKDIKQDSTYHRVGFVDGFLLRKTYSIAKRLEMKKKGNPNAEQYGIAGFRRPLKDGDMHNVDRANDLAYDPILDLEPTDIKLM